MKIKNLTVKPIGFGSTVILPDEVGTLPQGYGKTHPTVKYYLSRKWIKEIGSAGDSGTDEKPVNAGLGVNANIGGAGDAGTGASGDAGNGAGGNSGQQKTIDCMNKEELQALAFERGVEFAETDTKQVLINKIKAAQKSDE